MTNFLPKTQGAMRLRPGTKHRGSSYGDTGATWIEFIASTTETALLELTDSRLRVWDGDDDTLITRPTRSTTMSDFNADTGAWRLGDTGLSHGGTIGFGDTGLVLNTNYLGATARAQTKITLGDTGDKNVELGFKIHVSRGPVIFYAGSDTGSRDYVGRSSLGTGYHDIAITPPDTGGVHLTFETQDAGKRIVQSIEMSDTGVVSVTTPWTFDDLPNIRYAQSADVVYVAAYDRPQMQIERRGSGRSWSAVEYVSVNGPFSLLPTADVRLKPAASFGNTTLEADADFFDTGHKNALFRLTHQGQGGVYKFTHKNSYSDVWKVTGINDTGDPGERTVVVKRTDTGTFNGHVTLQRSFDGEDVGFRDVRSFNSSGTYSEVDPDDNITVYYRLAMGGDTGDHVKGALTCKVDYPHGSKDGVCRVTKYNSPTSVDIEVLSRFATVDTGNDSPYTDDWAEGRWSAAQAFPSSVALHEGRLFWFGGTRIDGSVSDDYTNFNAGTVGDAGPINRTLATGPVDRIHWAVSLLRLFLGTAGNEVSLRSTSLDEPLTPSNMAAKVTSTQGTKNLRALTIDDRAIFVQRAGNRLFMLAYDAGANDYVTQELTLLVPDLLSGVTSVAVQRQPDTRIHCVMDDGTVAIFTYQDQEQVGCWSLYWTTAASGFVEDVMILPGTTEDQVYYHVRRTVNGATKRFVERWAMESESVGDTGENWLMDCAVEVSLSDTGVATGLDHLEGEQVVVWGAKDLSYDDTGGNQKLYTVTGGLIQLDTGDTGQGVVTAQVGLPYIDRTTGKEMDAEYKTTKLAYAAAAGTALTMPKRVDHVGLILGKTHNNGLWMGPTLTVADLQALPRVINGREITDEDERFAVDTDIVPIPFPGTYDIDSRMCLAGKAPRISTVMAAAVSLATNDKV